MSQIPSDKVTLVAVSKTHPTSKIVEAYQAGQRHFGENKVQELVQKHAELPKDIMWHLLGHLQTNKVKQIVGLVHLIHSVDSVRLILEIQKQAKKISKSVKVLLQLHIAQEDTKTGFDYDELISLLNNKSNYPNIVFSGLMGIATNTDDNEILRAEFTGLHQSFEEIKKSYYSNDSGFNTLSMGMSSDYKLAIECGSTMIRVGSSIFGVRDYSVESENLS